MYDIDISFLVVTGTKSWVSKEKNIILLFTYLMCNFLLSSRHEMLSALTIEGVWVNCYRIHQKSLNFIYSFKFYSNFTNKNVSWLHFSWATQYFFSKALMLSAAVFKKYLQTSILTSPETNDFTGNERFAWALVIYPNVISWLIYNMWLVKYTNISNTKDLLWTAV